MGDFLGLITANAELSHQGGQLLMLVADIPAAASTGSIRSLVQLVFQEIIGSRRGTTRCLIQINVRALKPL
jgi:hypothetical protein